MIGFIAGCLVCFILGYKLGYSMRDDEAKKCDCEMETLNKKVAAAKKEAYKEARADLKKEGKK